MIRPALWTLILALGAAALRGQTDLLGLEAVRALRSWWAARQFESAAVHEDLDGLARLGLELAWLGAGDAPLRFAAHRVGFQVTGESWHLPAREAEFRALQGLELLETAIPGSEDPYDLRLTQALILVNRPIPARLEPLKAGVCELWLAAGGGPDHPLSAPGAAYRQALQLPAEQRSNFLIERFRIGPHEEE